MKEVTIEAVEQDPAHLRAGNPCYGCIFEENQIYCEGFTKGTGLRDCGDDHIYKIKETIEPFVVQSFKESFNNKDHSVLVSTEIKEK